MKINSRYLLETSSGYQEFLGVKRSLNKGLIIKHVSGEIRCTNKHLIKCGDGFVLAEDLSVGDVIQDNLILSIEKSNEEEYYYDPVQVEGDSTYISEGIVHHNCLVVDEAAFVKSTVWDEFSDSIFPSQSGLSWKKNIILSTANGMNHYYQMVQGAKKNENGMKLFEVDWKDVPRYKSDGSLYSNDEFKEAIIKKHGSVYFEQNYGNAFSGSSYTLISSNKMKEMEPKEPESIRDNKLKIYEYPIKGHNYFMMVDPAKDGKDAFAVQILDVSTLNFKQVAAAQLEIEYLKMPAYLMEWCELYNNPHLIIENNEGAGQSIADQIFRDYEYENLFFDFENAKSRKRKKYPGFRTTRGNRSQLLNTLKLFIENDMLEINDKATIDEFYTFIQTKNKYQADDGAHDDMVMSLAIGFAPFLSTRNFDDMGLLIKQMYSEEQSKEINFTESLTIGSFDDFTDSEEISTPGTRAYEEYISSGFGSDDFDTEGFF